MRTTLFVLFALLYVSASDAQPYCGFKGRDSLFVTVQQDTVYLWDMDACAYCSAEFGVSVTLRADTIYVVQTDTAGQIATCDCLFNLRTAIAGVPGGTYWITVYRNLLKENGYQFDTLQHIGTLQCHYEPAHSPGLSWNSFQSECNDNGHSQAYYPLEVGNRWEYGHLEYGPGEPSHFVLDRTVRVFADTLLGNGNRYAVLTGMQLVRQGGDTLLRYNPFIHGDEVVYYLTPNDSDTLTRIDPGDTLTTVVRRGAETLFGRLRTTWWISTGSSTTTFSSTLKVVDGIGYAYGEAEAGFNEYLLGAVINGVTYGTVTTVSRFEARLPEEPSLSQNYPNPFNPSTTIRYAVPHRSHVRLTVFNTVGQRVATLVNGEVEAGEHEVRFEASRLSTGVYFYRLFAEGQVVTKCLLVLK